MRVNEYMTRRLTEFTLWQRDIISGPDEDMERGDVPGWVLVTAMSAALVGALYLIARPQLEGILRDALVAVTP